MHTRRTILAKLKVNLQQQSKWPLQRNGMGAISKISKHRTGNEFH